MWCSTDPEIRPIICQDDSKTLIHPWASPHPTMTWQIFMEPKVTIKVLCIDLDLSYYFLFIFSPTSLHGSWGKVVQGGCVSFVCSLWADCSVMKWSSIKAWPRGQGRSSGIDSLPQNRLINTFLHQTMKWGGFRNVYLQTEHESQCNWLSILVMFWVSVTLHVCSESPVLGRS